MSSSPILLWYRNTLRMRDREPLDLAIRSKAPIFPVYCFDPRQFGQTAWGFPKTGTFRARFLLESVADLRQSLQALGSNLIVRYGKPEEEIPHLVREYKISCVYGDREITAEEVAVENALQRQLAALGVKMQTFWEASLLHPDDLPFSLTALPELFTNFRKQVEKNLTIREPYDLPERMPSLPPELNPGEIPTLEALGLEPPPQDSRAVLPFVGGETAGWARLHHYLWESDRLRTYKDTRNGMLGADYSSKFSAWLANGSLSPRSIYQQVRAYEQERVKNDSTYWLIFELLWRDYFRFICAKHGSKVFQVEGLQGLTLPWKDDARLARCWREGKTGYPLVDANMRELAATGFMSNRGRQNVASFLTKNLALDWRMGAEWFESLLIDYDVCSNYGNWNYVAGVGNDARGFRYFNIPKQSLDYDPQADYIKHWLPELTPLPAHLAREPWKMDASEQQRYGVQLGVEYPRPVVDFQRSVRENEQRYQLTIDN